MADPVTRSAARWAALIALPVALVAGLIAYRVLSRSGNAPAASPSPAPQATAPVAMPAPSLPVRDALVCQSLVSHLPVTGPAATTWTTVDREVPVAVTVPKSYDAQAQWVIQFAPPVATAIPAISTVPSGCKG